MHLHLVVLRFQLGPERTGCLQTCALVRPVVLSDVVNEPGLNILHQTYPRRSCSTKLCAFVHHWWASNLASLERTFLRQSSPLQLNPILGRLAPVFRSTIQCAHPNRLFVLQGRSLSGERIGRCPAVQDQSKWLSNRTCGLGDMARRNRAINREYQSDNTL
ncbi:hypothetical protein NEOLEDRAFT_1142607 [Neolentinus lepideus HHB14362 ss-1]|uniref:Uncharacterized protein n=1 Tax=Neolentinus lepideus HHB14362 ss-1 TaxID=1314782 RepID=A0A165N0I5_9AGAM|nr:hypothetical protein NEOLEDRAFT_1142607 [Neolentinus lepideus HHB14362 ss-1]